MTGLYAPLRSALHRIAHELPVLVSLSEVEEGPLTHGNQHPDHPPPPQLPRGVATSGILFSMLYMGCLILIRLSIPSAATETGDWLADPAKRVWSSSAVNLVPFVGIAFLWFMGALRHRIGLHEDRFLSTVFLGSGLLFVAMLFASAAVTQGVLLAFGGVDSVPAQSETFRFARGTVYVLMMVCATKMSAVFIFVTSSIGLRTAVLSRWVCYTGFVLGLVLLFVIAEWAWIALLFPAWALLISVWILVAEFRPPTHSPHAGP